MALKDRLKEVKDKFKRTEEPSSEAEKRMQYQRAAAKESSTQVKTGKE